MLQLMDDRRYRLVVLALAMVLAFSAGSAFVALGSNHGEVIYACLSRNGQLTNVTVGSEPQCRGQSTVISWNEVGPQGQPGLQGADGEDGADGEQGPPGISGWERVDSEAFEIPPGERVRFQAICPEGKRLLGGGFGVNPQLIVEQSTPILNTRWEVIVFNPQSSVTPNRFASARAICAVVEVD